MRLIVTGGRSDIGQAIIRRRFQVQDVVLTTASSEVTKDDLLKKLQDLPNVEACVWDLKNPESNAEQIDQFILQGIDGLILNAAPPTVALKKLHEATEEEINEAIQMNIKGNVSLIRRCLPKMIEQNFGRIVFISSFAVNGQSRYPLYVMTKSAIEGLIKVLSNDYGENNIYSNIIRPGIIATQRTKRFWSRSIYIDKVTEAIPAKKLGTPVSIAEALDPFLSPNSYLNGATLEVTGGLPNIRSEILLK